MSDTSANFTGVRAGDLVYSRAGEVGLLPRVPMEDFLRDEVDTARAFRSKEGDD